MTSTAADILIDSLHDWGVEVIFGLPGDGINGIMESLRRRHEQIRFIQVRHEEAAAFMACGYAKYSGKLGACLATSGPGGIHLLNGLYDAKLDGQPVLAITGHHYHDLIDTHAQQDVNLDRLFADVIIVADRLSLNAQGDNSCRRSKLWRELGKPSRRESPSARRPANLFVKRCITSGKADTALGPLNRRSR
jgi:thiamine pyrophosphate-dependent acetolactate synthase large subunit-like protein